MTPQKRATSAKETPSLNDMLAKDNETPVDAPVKSMPNDTDTEGNPRVETNSMPNVMAGRVHPTTDEAGNVTTNAVWEEQPDQNLGKLHPDVLPQAGPNHQAQTSRMTYVTEYAGVSENDDKGLVGPEFDPDNPDNGEPVSEYAPENEHDDKNIKKVDTE